MMGVAFAEHLVRFMSEKGHIMRGATTIARNPDQSKHLETAMVNVLGLDIDLVNLRGEVYAEESRIPSEVVHLFSNDIFMKSRSLATRCLALLLKTHFVAIQL